MGAVVAAEAVALPEEAALVGTAATAAPEAAAVVSEAASTVASAASTAAESVLPESVASTLGIGADATEAEAAAAVEGTTAEEAAITTEEAPATEESSVTDVETSKATSGFLEKILGGDTLTAIVNIAALVSIAGPLALPLIKPIIMNTLGQSKSEKSLLWASRILNTAASVLEVDDGSPSASQLAESFRKMAVTLEESKGKEAKPADVQKEAAEKLKKESEFGKRIEEALRLAKEIIAVAKKEGAVAEQNPDGKDPAEDEPPNYMVIRIPDKKGLKKILEAISASKKGSAEPHVGGSNLLADAMVPDWTGQMVGRVPLLFIQVALFVILVLIMILLFEMDWKTALLSGYVGASAGTLGVLAVCRSGSGVLTIPMQTTLLVHQKPL